MNARRTLLITGVSRRIGAHLAAHYLARGDRVIGTYRQETDELAKLREQGLHAVQIDLTDTAALAGLIDDIAAYTDRLDAIVHNASIWPSDADCDADCTRQPPLISQLYQLHVTTPVQLTLALQHRLPAPIKDGRATRTVVFLTDTKVSAGSDGHLHYLASKAAAQSAMRSLAISLAPHTRANAIAPGLILFHEQDSAEKRANRLAKNLLPFEPGAEVIAQSMDYLLDCSAVTGITLPVDCGLHLLNPSARD
ncbi:SDR family oxidoreductase [Halothiobacillus neapolitanus]|uniref:Dihydrofolate reductase n=1 Tax=Halothiobacillus neapolitanus (strain ATCC 23641 / DSM 15147 / CIP 104769 / NCIMB 8539 / c2) TaxID=555778 RepID=D0KW32_HALNC|nr:SDR family oxidoreductase [Halothiobacillus neapolitanus]ACX96935.1 Dihydrofolate reductase [Halothiobacillus neapolitanus c2]TDN64950.1 dihydromonapterin reductase/dihydrofolate reductase [Halothiobacillus neapolitanus]